MTNLIDREKRTVPLSLVHTLPPRQRRRAMAAHECFLRSAASRWFMRWVWRLVERWHWGRY